MALITNAKTEVYDFWSELWNNFLPLNFFRMERNFEFIIDGVDINSISNTTFWLFLVFAISFAIFNKVFEVFSPGSKLKLYKRKQFSRALWNVAFYSASITFLFFYHKYMISPELADNNSGRLFPKYENTLFYRSQPCERFQIYSIVIFTFYLHSTLLDLKEGDYLEAASKIVYTFSLIAVVSYSYENYFVLLNTMVGIYQIITECLLLIALQLTDKFSLLYKVLFSLRVISWSHIFINILPFKYLLPVLFNKDLKIFLNVTLWFWYTLSIWNSPILRFFYHQIYHSGPFDCIGDGKASECLLLKDTADQRHYKTLKKCCFELKKAQERIHLHTSGVEDKTTKTLQTIKCVMTLKRKLKRIREEKQNAEKMIVTLND